MPLTLKLPLPDGGTLALWKIDEDENALARLCTTQERETAAAFATPHRRCEYLAWHALLHTLLPGAETSHDAVGGPVLHVAPEQAEGKPSSTPAPMHIGVSHTRGYAAVIVAPQPCAVDIELTTRNFSRAARRFLSPAEEALRPEAMPQELFRAFVWCAKEAAYKWARQDGLDLLRDIRIVSIAPNHTDPDSALPGTAGHRLELSTAGQPLTLNGFLFEGMCCVYGIRPK